MMHPYFPTWTMAIQTGKRDHIRLLAEIRRPYAFGPWVSNPRPMCSAVIIHGRWDGDEPLTRPELTEIFGRKRILLWEDMMRDDYVARRVRHVPNMEVPAVMRAWNP